MIEKKYSKRISIRSCRHVVSFESTEHLKNPWFSSSVPRMVTHSKSFEPISHRETVVHIQSESNFEILFSIHSFVELRFY